MDLLCRWCMKKSKRVKRHHLAIWVLFITVLLMVDVGVSKESSMIQFHSKELDGIEIFYDDGTISKEQNIKCTEIPESKIFNVKNNLILNVINKSENISYRIFPERECIVYVNFLKYNILIMDYTAIIVLICAIIFYLEKILSYIQDNDGKKGIHSILQFGVFS